MIRMNLFLFISNVRKDLTSFTINLTGLSTGLACVLLIYLWVYHKRNVDKYLEKDRRLYQEMVINDGLKWQ